MKIAEHISVLPVVAATLIGSAMAMGRASASDVDTGARSSALSCGQIAAVIELCSDCNHTMAAPESSVMPKTAILGEAKKPEGSRPTFTAFGFVIHGNKGDQTSEWLTRAFGLIVSLMGCATTKEVKTL